MRPRVAQHKALCFYLETKSSCSIYTSPFPPATSASHITDLNIMDATLGQVESSKRRQRTDDVTSSLSGATEMATARDEVDMSTRDSDYWFEDGNIILVSRGVAFRVYKGLLGEHSAVFGSMFDIGRAPQAASDQAYGCPVIRLDDSPDDIRGLFRLIYPLNRTLRLVLHSIHRSESEVVPLF